jgi:hypothetical protein
MCHNAHNFVSASEHEQTKSVLDLFQGTVHWPQNRDHASALNGTRQAKHSRPRPEFASVCTLMSDIPEKENPMRDIWNITRYAYDYAPRRHTPSQTPQNLLGVSFSPRSTEARIATADEGLLTEDLSGLPKSQTQTTWFSVGVGGPTTSSFWNCMFRFCGDEPRLTCDELIRCPAEGQKTPHRLAAAFSLS